MRMKDTLLPSVSNRLDLYSSLGLLKILPEREPSWGLHNFTHPDGVLRCGRGEVLRRTIV